MSSMMEYKGYHALVTYDVDTKMFAGKVVDSPISMGFRVTSPSALREAFAGCVDNYIDWRIKNGKLPEPGTYVKDTYKVQQLTKMLSHEKASDEEHYGAHLTHWYGDAKPLTIDAGGLEALINYYSGYPNSR